MDEIFYIEDGAEVAPPAWIRAENRFGSVPGLPDNELASPAELERAYYRELWGPILMLPKPKSASFNPAWDCHSELGYNGFATVDFERMMPEFDKARYTIDKLKEQLKDLVIMVSIVNERIKDVRKYKILRLVGKGILDADDIQHGGLWQLAVMYKRALRLKKEILRLQEMRRQRQKEAYEKWLES